MNEKTDNSLGMSIKSPLFLGLAALSIILLVVVLVQSSTISSLRSENKALSDRILELEEALQASQEKNPANILESVVGSATQLAEDAKQALENAKESFSSRDVDPSSADENVETSADTSNKQN